MQRIQILGGSEGHFFATQIGALQPSHGRRTEGTLGVGMSAQSLTDDVIHLPTRVCRLIILCISSR